MSDLNFAEKTLVEKAIALIDEANRLDPRQEMDEQGQTCPKELLYSYRMSTMLMSFFPGASEELRIAARGQHIERWKVPRETEPVGRDGYKRWRRNLLDLHAKRVSEIMADVGYKVEPRTRVEAMIKKLRMKHEPEVQILEDVICLVFLKHEFDAFRMKHPEDKVIDIVQKTWAKMSSNAHTAALQLDLSKPSRLLVERALQNS